MPNETDKAILGLLKRGYLQTDQVTVQATPLGSKAGELWKDAPLEVEDEALTRAIGELKQRYGIGGTASVDAELVEFLNQPHCSVPDRPGPAGMSAGGVAWPRRDLTFDFMNWPPGLDQNEVREAFVRAFATWTQVTGITFIQGAAAVDMRIVFGTGDHGDQWPFADHTSELAHAFYPDWPDGWNGDVHINTAWHWSLEAAPTGDAKSLETVALHEIGHALGLPHANRVDSIMWPNYQGPATALSPFDVDQIRALYP